MIRLPTESTKLKLASDMTQVEFGLNQMFNASSMKLDHAIPKSYASLRAFKFEFIHSIKFMNRPGLFQDTLNFMDKSVISTLPLVVLMNLLCLRTYPLILCPHILNGWSETIFSNWIDTHSDTEICELYERSLDKYALDIQTKNGKEYCPEYTVLKSLCQKKDQK